MKTQRFLIALATDDDVEQREIGQVMEALGYHGVFVLAVDLPRHECPCPSGQCIDRLRQAGHVIAEGTMCCDCWALDPVRGGDAP